MNIEGLREVIKHEFLTYNSNENKRLHHFRIVFEPYIYNILIKRYSNYLDDFWKNYFPPKRSDKAFVIIERRCHPNYWFILRNIAWANPDMSVYIICSDQNESFIKTLLGDKVEHFNILPLFKGSPDRDEAIKEYNMLLTDYTFYEKINAKYMLTIQMDVFIRKKLTDDIFTGDYWGAPWAWKQELPGGGGATIRNISKMIELCKYSNKYEKIDGVIGQGQGQGEDSWISDKIMSLGWTFPDIEIRKRSIMESIPTPDPFIIHQFWTFFSTFSHHFDSDVFYNFLNHMLTFYII
jgi:hypothetical protein